MAINPVLNPLTLPSGTEFPGTPQLLLALIAQYMEINGLEDLGGVNFGPTTPGADDRDKPWFKTDNSYVPLGWFSWNGSAWQQILFNAPSGTTANRPSSPTEGQFYLDTDIDVLLIYERSAWRTADGSPGDIKFVSAATSADALTKNPGWVVYTAAESRVIAAASGATGKDNADIIGAETHALVEAELPAHTHTVSGFAGLRSNIDLDTGGTDYGSQTASAQTSSSTGSGTAHNNMQPTIYHWCLIKS